jgi:HlyD family secretion protein
VKIAIVNNVEKLRPGMSATVDIRTESRHNILEVPIQSITVRAPKDIPGKEEKSKAGKDTTKATEKDTLAKPSDKAQKDEMIEVVFIVKDGVAKIVPVVTGISSDTDVEIKSGLEESQEVVTGSYRVLTKSLKDGSRVKIGDKAASKTKE